MKFTQNTRGFTLIEILVVIAILGILMAVGFGSYTRWRQATQVRTGADQVVYALNKVRTGAKRQNVNWTFSVVNAQQFSYGPTSGTKTTETLESGTQFSTTTVGTSVQFDAPWGAMTQYAAGLSSVPKFAVQSKANSALERSVQVVSLLGEVVVK